MYGTSGNALATTGGSGIVGVIGASTGSLGFMIAGFAMMAAAFAVYRFIPKRKKAIN